MSEINNIKTSVQTGIQTSRNGPADTSKAAASAVPTSTAAATDKLSLTDTASQLQSLQKSVADMTGVDQQRVEALRAAIADGSYQVDADKLARNMIDLESQF